MKKLILIFFMLFNYLLYSSNLPRDVDIINMPLHDVLSILSKESGENIICSNDAKDLIIDTYFNKGENIDVILQGLANTYDLNIRNENNMKILYLQKEENSKKAKIIGKIMANGKSVVGAKIELKDINKTAYSDKNGFFIIDSIPKNVYLCKISKDGYEEKGEIIDTNKSITKINIHLEKNSTDDFENSNIENENFYENGNKILYTKTFSIKNISSKEVETTLKETFGDSIKVSSLEKINKLIVNAERDILDNVTSVIENIDKNPRQVKISSEILDISNNLFQELGFDWFYNRNVLSRKDFETKYHMENLGYPGTILKLSRKYRNKEDILNIGLKLLQENNDIVVSSIPTLTIASGEEGEFKVTDEVIVGIRNEKRDDKNDKNNKNDKSNKYRNSEPVFREAGLVMKVKPFIKDNDNIILEISLELSEFKLKSNSAKGNEINSGTYNSDGGSKNGRSLKTKVRLKNGDTILLGGLKRTLQQTIENKIPFLGDIPIIGFFFKNTTKRNENSDMYIKLTVNIEKN